MAMTKPATLPAHMEGMTVMIEDDAFGYHMLTLCLFPVVHVLIQCKMRVY